MMTKGEEKGSRGRARLGNTSKFSRAHPAHGNGSRGSRGIERAEGIEIIKREGVE